MKATVEERFWDKVRVQCGCWVWTAARAQGYGMLRVDRKPVGAHRFSYEMHKGAIPAGLQVMHSCDVRECVNPDHLSVGTALDNARDKIAKGRAPIWNPAWRRPSAPRSADRSADRSGQLYGAAIRLTHCRRGHPMSGDNLKVYQYPRRIQRVCLACEKIRKGSSLQRSRLMPTSPRAS